MMGKMEIRSPPGSRPRDGRHCDLCGCSQPAVRCDKCGCQIFCLSCDDMYHRHPKRRFHLRKAVDTIPPVPQARPVLPMKVSHLNAISPGDPSKMPLPPPRKKKSLFSSFRKPTQSSEQNSPPLPKKEYSWTDRLGSIKKFMSNRPLPPLPTSDDNETETQPTTNGQAQRGDLSFIHKRTEERPPQLPQRSPRTPDFPGFNQEKENRIPSTQPHLPGQVRNGSIEPNANHMNQNHEFNSNDPNQWNNRNNHQNDAQAFGTLHRQRPFMPHGAPGYPSGMHQSSSATDLHSMHNAEGMHGPIPPHYPHYPMNPHMPPHYPYPMYPGYPNYPQYFGNSFANLSNPPTSEGDFSDSESSSRHSSKRHAFRKRAKRSQSVVVDRMAYPGQFFPFGPYPGYGPWGAPMPMETPPSPASSVKSLNRTGRTRRRKKGTSEDDDEELSETSSPMSRPKSSSSDPKEHPRAPLATQTTSSEDESDNEADRRRNKVNTIRRQSEPVRSPSPAVNKKVVKLKKSSSKQSDSDTQESPAVRNDRRPSDSTTEQRQPIRQSPVQQQSSIQRSPTPQQPVFRESPVAQSTSIQPQTSISPSPPSFETWECKHCTFINPVGNRICQVCCKTATPRTETPVSNQSRPSSSSAKNRKESVGSENEYFVPEENNENEASKKDNQDMASLNSALDEAEKQISKGLEELMKLKDDIDSNAGKEKAKQSDNQPKMDNEQKPVYKSSGRMRTSILDKLNLNKPQTTNSSVSTSTETQTDRNNRTIDKIIEARRLSNSSTASETYNSPLAQSPELEREYQGSKQKRDSSCQTQQDTIADYLEKRKAAEEAFLGRPINNFGFGYGDRMDMVTSPVPSMYDRFYGGGYGMMQRSHSRASLFTGRMNDFGPMEYGPGFGYGPAPMYRSVSRGSLTGDYPDGRRSGFHNLSKPDYYLSMEELVERRCQDNINNIRAQGLELVRMIREAEQQGFNADDIQVALTHCGKQNPLEWLQENWRNMVDSVVTLSTNYGNDKKENDIGLLSENEARDALRLHKGNIWAAVTECVEGRQRKYLELSARGNFSRQDIVDALTSSEGDVEMAYAKLTKSTGKPFLMRIWGQGEGAQNQDGAQPMAEDFRDGPRRYLKDDTLNNDDLSDDLWSEDEEAVDWDDEEDYEEERGDIEDLRTCQEDLPSNAQEITTPESEKSDYCDAFSVDDRNVSSPSDDVFFVIPEAKPEKKKGFLSKLAALRKDSKERAETNSKEAASPQQDIQPKEDSTSQKITSSEQKNGGALSTLKNTFSAFKDSVTGGPKNEKKIPIAQVERRTIIVRGQLEHESLSTKEEMKSSPVENLLEENTNQVSKADAKSKEQIKHVEESMTKETPKLIKKENNVVDSNQIKTEKINLENESREADSMKVENKSSQSLAERLKSAKQTRSSFDAPGPSGINKESLALRSTAKDDSPVQTPKETSLEKHVDKNSKTTLEIESVKDKVNIDKVSSIQNLEKSEYKEKSSNVIQSKQQIPENISNTNTIKPKDNDQCTVNSQADSISKVPGQNVLEKSDIETPNKSTKNSFSTKELLKSSNLDSKKENSPILQFEEKIESKTNLESAVPSKTAVTKIKENKSNSASIPKTSEEDHMHINKVTKQNNASKTNTIKTVANLPESNTSGELKRVTNKKQEPKTKDALDIESSPKISDSKNKITVATKKDDSFHCDEQKDKHSKASNKKEELETKVAFEKELSPKASNLENKIIITTKTDDPFHHVTQEDEHPKESDKHVENKISNVEALLKSPELSKTEEILNNSDFITDQKSSEKSQKILKENNKTELTASTIKENFVVKDNENISKDVNSTKTVPEKDSVPGKSQERTITEKLQNASEIHKMSASKGVLKLNDSQKTITIQGIPKTEADIPSDHNTYKGNLLPKSEKAATDLGTSKNLEKQNLTEISKHDTENNSEKSETLLQNKSVDPSPPSSNAILENTLTPIILENSSEHLNIDNDKLEMKLISDVSSSNHDDINQTNVANNLDTTNKENSIIVNKDIGNIPQTSMQRTEEPQKADTDISCIQNVELASENSHGTAETKTKNIEGTFQIFPDNKDLVAVAEKEKSGQKHENKEESITPSASEVVENLASSNNSVSTLIPASDMNTIQQDVGLKNDVDVLNKSTSEQNKNEIPVNEKVSVENETTQEIIGHKSSESEMKFPEFQAATSQQEDESLVSNIAVQQSQTTPLETSKNTSASVENQEIITPVTTSSKSEENNVTVNKNISVSIGNQETIAPVITSSKSEESSVPVSITDTVKEQTIQPISESDTFKNTDLSFSEIINQKTSNETKLQEPVFSKEFPNKNIAEVPGPSASSDANEKVLASTTDKSVNAESIPTTSNTDISNNLKASENTSITSTSETNKASKEILSTNNLDNTSTSKGVPNKSESIIKPENIPSDSKTMTDTGTVESSPTEIKSLSIEITENFKTDQNSSSTNPDNSSKIEKTVSLVNTANDSIKEVSSNTASSAATPSTSLNSTTDNSKTISSLSSTKKSESIKSKENSISELPASSSDIKSSINESSAPKLNEKHSKTPETVATNSSASTSTTNSHAESSVQSRKFQRTLSEEKNEASSSASESDDTDIEYSDNSRRGSLILPSPVDTLRSRFEGLASGTIVRGGPVRPASPFRRMSFNSRKQVIALERKKDTSSDKSWFHKINTEPVKIVQPKRSIKQQLEMERKVRKMVADRKCRTYKKAEIVVQLMDMNFEEEEAIQAANECSTLEQALSYLQQECLLCAGHFPVSQIVSMTHCEHRACRECIRAYFTVQIRDRTILDLLCPFCNEPDITDEDVAQDYFNHLDIMLKKLVDIEIHELFQRKLRDRVLMKDPNFRWCSQCSSGFIAMPNLKRLICPDCNAVTCASCRRLWEKEHQGISCEAFAALKDASDPEAQAAGLAKMLTEDGISCPSCHFRYALAKGGCMHFRCIQCQHDFCSGCSRPFKMGQKCGVSEFCAKLGLHAHHPRNCLFYLRDKEPEDLQKLLDMNDVKYNREPPDGMEIKATCQVMEQKETADGMVDDYCGKEVQDGFAGLCRVHYVEYLGQLVNKYKVDPIQIFDNDDLELVLKRANIRLPPKRYRENDVQYREKLIKVIQEELPLDRMDGS